MTAATLTSWLPICTKLLVRDVHPSIVAWCINAVSLPILAVGALVLVRGTWPRIDTVFTLALVVSAVLNWVATVFSTRALALADASLVSPLLTFNPAFTLIVAWLVLGERPGAREALGVGVILFGAYLLDLEGTGEDTLGPLRTLLQRPGTLLALVASACWGITTVLEKIAIMHANPPSGPLVALASTLLTVLLLTPGALNAQRMPKSYSSGGLRTHPRALASAILIAGIAPLFGFSAIALGFVGYVTALFKVSAVLTVLWAWLVLREGNLRQRLAGTLVMLAGGALIAV